jgi:hypothetical protein
MKNNNKTMVTLQKVWKYQRIDQNGVRRFIKADTTITSRKMIKIKQTVNLKIQCKNLTIYQDEPLQ